MKRIVFFLLIVGTAIGCNTDFSVNGEYEDTPIVHMLLDPNDEFHFLKVNKSFLGDGNANTFASVPDSSYFNNVNNLIEEVIGGQIVRRWTSEVENMTTVDQSNINSFTFSPNPGDVLYPFRDTIIDNKEPGAFYYPEQKLYYFKAEDLDEEALYRLTIEIDNGKHLVTGETNLVKDVGITFPNPNQQLSFAESDVPANGYRTQSISFTKGTGAVYNGRIKFDYRETTASGTETKSITWNLGSFNEEDVSFSTPSFSASGELFYELIRNRVPVDNNVTRRTPYSFELLIKAGSEDLRTYMLVNEPTSSLAQNKPTFTNVNGGLGIFSARTTVSQLKYVINPTNPNIRALNVSSTKELCEGQYTFDRGFCSNHPNDIAQGYSFACN